MEKIKLVIVEDEFIIAEDLRSQLQREGYDVTAVFDNGEDALSFLRDFPPDIVLVDIQLAGAMTGVSLVEELNTQIQVPVIYITANSDAGTYQRARHTRPQSFLIKPFSSANLLASIDLALFNFATANIARQIQRDTSLPGRNQADFVVNEHLFVRASGKFRKVAIDDLLFVEADGSYLKIHTIKEQFTLSQNLKSFERKCRLPRLIRVHRSYVVNLNRVDSFDDSFVFILQHKIPVSDSYRQEFLSKLQCL